MEKENLVVVASYDNALDANILKGYLESNGIVAGVLGDSLAGTLMRGFAQGDFRVVVLAGDEQEALKLLAARPDVPGDSQFNEE